jgi:hypothetical protein
MLSLVKELRNVCFTLCIETLKQMRRGTWIMMSLFSVFEIRTSVTLELLNAGN